MITEQALQSRSVVFRTSGHRRGPITRLMSPSDLGELLRPFVFLDHVDTQGVPRAAQGDYGLHPHSGIATVTWLLEGRVNYEDTLGRRGQISLALPPAAELGEAESSYLAPHLIKREGPASVLLGRYGSAASAIASPSPVNYLSVKLKAGEQWRYQPPAGHTVAWAAVGEGRLRVPQGLRAGELAVFDESPEAIDFHAEVDSQFVLGSAAKHPHDLVLGYYSVHTSAAALREGEARIRQIGARLRAEGRVG